MDCFTMHNTEGYSAEELAELNRRFAAAARGVEDTDTIEGKSALDFISERVLREFDDEKPGRSDWVPVRKLRR